MTSASIPLTTPSCALLARARGVLDIEIKALEDLRDRLDASFIQAVELIETTQTKNGRLIVTGMGKSGHIGRKIAATLASTGTPAFFVHPGEGSHGDLGMIMPNDSVLALSNSGETAEVLGLLPTLKRFAIPVISITGKPASTLAKRSDVHLNIAVEQEACPLSLAPTASTTATLALGDALAVVLMERKGFTPDDFALFHPAGSLGKQLLLTVADVMHPRSELPVCSPSTSFIDALMESSEKRLGLTLVMDREQLQGILTDGDIRRALQAQPNAQTIQLTEVMTQEPATIEGDLLAVRALRLMQEKSITSLIVTDEQRQVVGLIHLHDLLKAGLH